MPLVFATLFASVLSACVYPVLSASAASCATTSLTPTNSVKPSVASGYQLALIATGLTQPRSIKFDTLGNLLVVQDGVGVANLVLQDDGGICLSVKSKKDVIKDKNVSSEFAGEVLFCSHGVAAEPRSSIITGWEDSLCLILGSGFFVDL